MHVVIIGAGIGGLTLGLCCIGTGISIGCPRALHVGAVKNRIGLRGNERSVPLRKT